MAADAGDCFQSFEARRKRGEHLRMTAEKITSGKANRAHRPTFSTIMATSFKTQSIERNPRMSLTLYYHPLSSFCWKALVALYENDTPFTAQSVDLSDEAERAALLKLWPVGKFPVLRDAAKDRIVPESSIIVEYLDTEYPGRTRFIAAEPKLALQTRLRDRFYDLYVHLPMQKIVGDRLRPAGARDAHGVEEAKARIASCYGMLDREMASRDSTLKTWAMGEAFSLADCAAAPALFYASKVVPFGDAHKNLGAYFDRLKARPSFARVLQEAEPYFKMFPQ
jgi:glutathione S-transferase